MGMDGIDTQQPKVNPSYSSWTKGTSLSEGGSSEGNPLKLTSQRPLTDFATFQNVPMPNLPLPKGNILEEKDFPEKEIVSDFQIFQGPYEGWGVIGSDGKLYRKRTIDDKAKLEQIGKVEQDGNFKLFNNQKGNIFNNDGIFPYLEFSVEGGELGKKLREKMVDLGRLNTKKDQERIQNEVRKFKDSKGRPIDGSGITTVIMEGTAQNQAELENKIKQEKGHAGNVGMVVKSKEMGIARGSELAAFLPTGERTLLPEALDEAEKIKDPVERQNAFNKIHQQIESLEKEPAKLAQYLAQNAVKGIHPFTSGIEKLIADKQTNAGLRIVNISDGPDMDHLLVELDTLWERKNQYPQLAKEMMKFKQPGDSDKLAMLRYLKKCMSDNPEYNQALGQWQDVTQKAAQAGLFITVAAGNHRTGTQEEEIFAGSSLNDLAKSKHVITVTASHSNGTPEDYTDDTVWERAARGNGTWNPTLAASGQFVQSPHLMSKVGCSTSDATPRVSATLALMLQLNPNLTFEEGVDILNKACTQRPGRYTQRDYGAGILDPVKAVQLTRERLR